MNQTWTAVPGESRSRSGSEGEDLFMWRTRKWKTDSSKNIVQEIAKKLRNHEESVAKKQIEPDNGELMSCLCNRRGTLRMWVTFRLKFGIYRCKRKLRSWSSEQLWSNQRSRSNLNYSEFQNRAALRFWIGAWYAQWYGYFMKSFLWTTTSLRRTILCNLQQFKEFSIFVSGIEAWRYRNKKEKREWNDKSIVDYVGSFTPLPK